MYKNIRRPVGVTADGFLYSYAFLVCNCEKQDVFVNTDASATTESKLVIFRIKVTVKVTRSSVFLKEIHDKKSIIYTCRICLKIFLSYGQKVKAKVFATKSDRPTTKRVRLTKTKCPRILLRDVTYVW